VRRAGRLENAANRPADERYAAYRSSVFDYVKADAAAVGIEPIRMGVFGFNDVEPLLAELSRRGEAGVVVINDALLASADWRPSDIASLQVATTAKTLVTIGAGRHSTSH